MSELRTRWCRWLGAAEVCRCRGLGDSRCRWLVIVEGFMGLRGLSWTPPIATELRRGALEAASNVMTCRCRGPRQPKVRCCRGLDGFAWVYRCQRLFMLPWNFASPLPSPLASPLPSLLSSLSSSLLSSLTLSLLSPLLLFLEPALGRQEKHPGGRLTNHVGTCWLFRDLITPCGQRRCWLCRD